VNLVLEFCTVVSIFQRTLILRFCSVLLTPFVSFVSSETFFVRFGIAKVGVFKLTTKIYFYDLSHLTTTLGIFWRVLLTTLFQKADAKVELTLQITKHI
jgi:hypothetical protein